MTLRITTLTTAMVHRSDRAPTSRAEAYSLVETYEGFSYEDMTSEPIGEEQAAQLLLNRKLTPGDHSISDEQLQHLLTRTLGLDTSRQADANRDGRLYHCESCGTVPAWVLLRHGDAAVTWACAPHLAEVADRLERPDDQLKITLTQYVKPATSTSTVRED